MRRFLIVFLCCLLLTTAVCAAGSVSTAQNTTTVSSDGTCEITMLLQLTLDQADSVRYPLPADAYDITVNGSGTKTVQEYLVRWVDLSKAVPGSGTYTVNLHYTLPDRVTRDKKGLTLTIPLLSGFSYPIEQMSFSISLPGTPDARPVFTSTYYPETVESLMDYSIENQVISGRFSAPLKDHESLTMTLSVSESLFPQPIAKQWSLSMEDLFMYGLLLAAIVYWIIFLRCAPPQQLRRTQPADGLTAGELGCCLTGQGVDFPAIVLSWAQMGYLSIRIDRSGRVLLQKRMNMGNERSEFENRCFKTLFGSRHTIDGGSEYCGRLGRKMARSVPGARHYFRKGSGNPNIFRVISAGIGVFAGVSLAFALFSDTVWQVLFAIIFGLCGGVTSWLIQSVSCQLHLRRKLNPIFACVACVLWLILSRVAGELNVAIFLIITQLLAGIGSAYGGRRTEMGQQLKAEVLGLRRYLKSVSTEELQTILEHNPDYYFKLAPYAIALGVDRTFSRRFKNLSPGVCSYLSDDRKKPVSAWQWNHLLQQVISVLDSRRQRKIL